jgi:hypothetical protein
MAESAWEAVQSIAEEKTMRSLKSRVEGLEYRSGGGINKQGILIWVWGWKRLALPQERIMEILKESGHLPETIRSLAMVKPIDIPDGWMG